MAAAQALDGLKLRSLLFRAAADPSIHRVRAAVANWAHGNSGKVDEQQLVRLRTTDPSAMVRPVR